MAARPCGEPFQARRCASERNEAPSAAAALRRVRDIMAALLTRSPDNAQWRSDRDQFDREIARLESQSQSDGLN
jgi:hypothetical protein